MGAKKKKKKQKRKKEKPNSGGTKSDSASDSQEIKIHQPSKVSACCLVTSVVPEADGMGLGSLVPC